MNYRDIGCRDCRAVTTGDCGQHGPRIIGTAAMTESPPVHDVDCENAESIYAYSCACSYRASIVALERQVQRLVEELRDEHNANMWPNHQVRGCDVCALLAEISTP
jgi:hypothetical protein